MTNYFVLISLLVFGLHLVHVNGAQREKEDDIKEKAYCYRFSWLGPKYNNDTDFGTGTNLTCSDVVSNTEVNPCRQPLVVTYDGTRPDLNYLYENFGKTVMCEMTLGEVCVKYTHFLNRDIQNITYMCASVTVEGSESQVTKGCYEQKLKNGRKIEACICKSHRGVQPCNTGKGLIQSIFLLSFAGLQLYLFNTFFNY